VHGRIKLSVYVPVELHRKAKYASFEHGTTIQKVVEDAMQEKFDPQHRSITPAILTPKEIKVLQAQLKQILERGDELAIANLVSAIRGNFKWLHIDRRPDETASAPAAALPASRADRKRRPRGRTETHNPVPVTGT